MLCVHLMLIKTWKQKKSVDDSTFNILNSLVTTENVTFFLVLSNDIWKTLKPIKKTYCTHKYVLLQPGKWTHIFASKIWEQKKFPCAFAFKDAKVFLSIDAKYNAYFMCLCVEVRRNSLSHLLRKEKK